MKKKKRKILRGAGDFHLKANARCRGFEDVYRKAKAGIWPWLSYVCQVRSTAACNHVSLKYSLPWGVGAFPSTITLLARILYLAWGGVFPVHPIDLRLRLTGAVDVGKMFWLAVNYANGFNSIRADSVLYQILAPISPASAVRGE